MSTLEALFRAIHLQWMFATLSTTVTFLWLWLGVFFLFPVSQETFGISYLSFHSLRHLYSCEIHFSPPLYCRDVLLRCYKVSVRSHRITWLRVEHSALPMSRIHSFQRRFVASHKCMQKHIISRNTAEQMIVRSRGDQIRLELVAH